MAQPDQG